MAAEGQKIRTLNLSQREVAMTQQVCPQSARNTISLKLYLPECAPQAVKAAADQVLDSADIFAASLRHDALLRKDVHEWQMVYGEKGCTHAVCGKHTRWNRLKIRWQRWTGFPWIWRSSCTMQL